VRRPMPASTSPPFEFARFTDLDKVPETAPYFGRALDLSTTSDVHSLPPAQQSTDAQPSAAQTISTLGKSVFKRSNATESNTPAEKSTPKASKVPAASFKTPNKSPLSTPGKVKMTPQVVISTAPKMRLTPEMASLSPNVRDNTPSERSQGGRASRLSTTPSKPAESSSARRRKSGVVDLTTKKSSPISISSSSLSNSPSEEKEYQSYPCRWINCRAELHSFETFKQHVLKVHSKVKSNTVSPLLLFLLISLFNVFGKGVPGRMDRGSTMIRRNGSFMFEGYILIVFNSSVTSKVRSPWRS
jgi:hypothetical protein